MPKIARRIPTTPRLEFDQLKQWVLTSEANTNARIDTFMNLAASLKEKIGIVDRVHGAAIDGINAAIDDIRESSGNLAPKTKRKGWVNVLQASSSAGRPFDARETSRTIHDSPENAALARAPMVS